MSIQRAPTRLLRAPTRLLRAPTRLLRAPALRNHPMSTTPHAIRTSTHPRSPDLHTATITSLTHPAPHLLKVTLQPSTPVPFLPGQWLDLHLPGLAHAGGFTLTSSPGAKTLTLSVRHAPSNPAAAWLWGPVLGREVHLRVGGALVFPPAGFERAEVQRVVMLAGGVGVNPFLSMVAWIRGAEEWAGVEIRVLWGGKRGEWAYLEELGEGVELFETGEGEGGVVGAVRGRMRMEDVERAVGGVEGRVVYVCGPKGFAEFCVRSLEVLGVENRRVFCEKWW